ncbi:MAG: PAS domain S-box protein [Deltaproteobacteria bacterium]|nr:PAS domain S-box protein [Deltaproteobacteria bacterium]
MSKNSAQSNQREKLRERAKARYGWVAENISEMSPKEIRKLVHDLQTYQIELEIQNDELRRAQEELADSRDRYSSLYDRAPVGYVTVNHKGLIIEANITLVEMLGVERRFLVMQPISTFIFSDDQDDYYRQQRETIESKQGTCQVRMVRRDAEPFWVQIDSIVIEDQDENDIRIRTVIIDITERRSLEEEQKSFETRCRQQQKLEAIGTLAGGVAHEINNPISGILGYARLISDRLDRESPLIEFSDGILCEANRVADIVRNLLAFARQERESHSPAKIGDVVENTLSLIRTIIRSDQITLKVDVPGDLPTIKCRSQQIQQVLLNLLTNARDALNKRYPGYDSNKIIAVTVRPFVKQGRHWIRIVVEDRGSGIPEEIRDRVFDPFFTTKDRTKGTGLGLSISHGIVTDHHGELSVESEVGRGTRFYIDLPVNNGWSLNEAPGDS